MVLLKGCGCWTKRVVSSGEYANLRSEQKQNSLCKKTRNDIRCDSDRKNNASCLSYFFRPLTPKSAKMYAISRCFILRASDRKIAAINSPVWTVAKIFDGKLKTRNFQTWQTRLASERLGSFWAKCWLLSFEECSAPCTRAEDSPVEVRADF